MGDDTMSDDRAEILTSSDAREPYERPELRELSVGQTLAGTFESAAEGAYVGRSGGTDFFGNAS